MSNADFSAQPDAAPSQIAGMMAMCAAMALLPIGDAISKTLTGFAAPFDVTVWRTLAQAIWFLPLLLLARKGLRGSVLSWPAVLSGALVAVVSLCLIYAYRTMPIATAISIFFIEPLVLTLLAGPFLGEKPGMRRYIAVAIGLIGALIVIRPNFEIFGPVVLLPALGALAYALNMIVLRKATRNHRSALSFQIGVALSGAAILGGAQLALGLMGRHTTPLSDLPGWALGALFASGALIALTFLLITLAFSKVEASLLAPLQYLEILGATLVGYLVFGNFPDPLTILGTSIILASGIYVFYRERKSGAPARKIRARIDR
jgi:drug/metabolite transporter (DMT)-like permease